MGDFHTIHDATMRIDALGDGDPDLGAAKLMLVYLDNEIKKAEKVKKEAADKDKFAVMASQMEKIRLLKKFKETTEKEIKEKEQKTGGGKRRRKRKTRKRRKKKTKKRNRKTKIKRGGERADLDTCIMKCNNEEETRKKQVAEQKKQAAAAARKKLQISSIRMGYPGALAQLEARQQPSDPLAERRAAMRALKKEASSGRGLGGGKKRKTKRKKRRK